MKSRGFTLLELLVVIAIIGVLATIVLMATSEARKKATYNSILQQTKQVELALFLFLDDRHNFEWPQVINSGCNHIDYIITQSWPGCANATDIANFTGFDDFISGSPLKLTPGMFYTLETNQTTDVDIGGCVAGPPIAGGAFFRVGDDTNSPVTIPPLFLYIDNAMDGGDGALCGKIRYRSGADPEIYWIIDGDI